MKRVVINKLIIICLIVLYLICFVYSNVYASDNYSTNFPDENNYAALLTKIGTVDLTQSPNTPIGATLSNGVYSIVIPVEKMPADDVTTPVNIIVTLKDALGNSAEFTAFQLQKDNIYPLATVGTIKDADASTD